MSDDLWDVVVNDHLDEGLLEGATTLINDWFPNRGEPVVSPAYFRWKLGDESPAGRGWMTLAVHDGAVIGSAAATRKRFRFRGADLAVAEVGDTFTDPGWLRRGAAREPGADEYLSRSVFGRLMAETLARGDAGGVRLYFGVANDKAAPGYIKRFAFRSWWGRPIGTFTRPGPAYVAARTRVPVGATSALDRLHASLVAAIATRSIAVAEIGADDLGELDALWARTRDQRVLTPVRDAAFARHRFVDHPIYSYRLWVMRRRGATVGFFVTRQYRNTAGDHVVSLAELHVDETVHGLVSAAFAAAVASVGGRDVQYWSCWEERPWSGAARAAFGARRTFTPGLILRAGPGGDELLDVPDVAFSLATSDNV